LWIYEKRRDLIKYLVRGRKKRHKRLPVRNPGFPKYQTVLT
jgi:hypothetical protein